MKRSTLKESLDKLFDNASPEAEKNLKKDKLLGKKRAKEMMRAPELLPQTAGIPTTEGETETTREKARE